MFLSKHSHSRATRSTKPEPLGGHLAPHWLGEAPQVPSLRRCPLLLVAVGGESPDAPAVCRQAAEDRGAAVAGGVR
jgi:hypothetical protein